MDGFLLHPLGLCAGTAHQVMLCKGYNFWSGIGSDLGEITLIGTIIAIGWRVRKHFECHVDTCHKVGLHHVAGTPHRTCWPHHPVLGDHEPHRVSLGHIHAAHARANQDSCHAD